MKKLLKRTLTLLKTLEWSGTERGQGSSMGSDGTDFDSCPSCHGIMKIPGVESEWIESDIGHSMSCKFKSLLDDIKKELK